jgi:glycosyltransferase involved in cell wall biosynthesis
MALRSAALPAQPLDSSTIKSSIYGVDKKSIFFKLIDSPMRIGVDAACWSNSRGYGRFARELLKALLELDQKNDYIFFLDPETNRTPDLPGRIVRRIPPVSEVPTRAASAAGRRSIRDIWRMSRSAAKENLDLFFFPSVYTYFPLLGDIKKIVAIHDVIAEQFPDLVFSSRKHRLFWHLKVLAAIRQADVIVSVSEFSKRGIMDYYRLPARRIKVVSEAAGPLFCPLVEDDEFHRKLSQMNLNFSQRFILYVGGIAPHKNLPTLITAYSMLVKHPQYEKMKLILVGDYEKDVFLIDSSLRKQIERLNMTGRVVFAGFVPDQDLVYLYNAASVFVLPSFNEGFGLPALEAMSCGTPVIGSRTTSLPEIVGDAGLFFDPHNPQELLDRLLQVLSNETLREELSRRSLRRAAQYSWRRSAATLSSIFEELNNDAPAA